jgi:hypothetical protein
VAYHEIIGMTCFIITRSTIWIIIKPCKCDWRSILLEVEDVDNWSTLCRALLNPYLLGEVCLHDDANVKEALNKVLQRIRYPNYLWPIFKKLCKFCQNSSSIFSHPPNERPKLTPTWMVGFDWNWWMHICTHYMSHFATNVFASSCK